MKGLYKVGVHLSLLGTKGQSETESVHPDKKLHPLVLLLSGTYTLWDLLMEADVKLQVDLLTTPDLPSYPWEWQTRATPSCIFYAYIVRSKKNPKPVMSWSQFSTDRAQQQSSPHVAANLRPTINYWKEWLYSICNLVGFFLPPFLFWTVSDEGHLVLFQFQWIIEKFILYVKYGFLCHLYD